MTVYEVIAQDYWSEYPEENLGLYESKKDAYKALFENGYVIRSFNGRPTWMIDPWTSEGNVFMLARVHERDL